MSNLTKDGFDYSFSPNECSKCNGNCCIGESGYIWVTPLEIKNISKVLNLDIDEFKKSYLNKIKYKFSIKERRLDESNFACVFFDLDKRQCSIYEARPNQCRTFPFWDYFKENIDEVVKECPAVKPF